MLESENSALRRTQSAAKGGGSRSAQVAAEKQRVKSDVESTEGRIIDARRKIKEEA